MAGSGGHWKTLEEAQKLTQSLLIPKVMEEDIKRGNLIEKLPVAQAANSGKSIKWNREKTTLESAVEEVAIGGQLSWTEDVEYDEMETELKRCYIQRKLDKFVEAIYGNINNYEAQILLECKKGMLRKLGDKIFYDDITYGSTLQFDGLHALAALEVGTDLDIDMAHAGLQLAKLRILTDTMKHGIDLLVFPYCIARHLDAAYHERGLVLQNANLLGMMSYEKDAVGKRISVWDNIPILRSDYLVAEQQDTGKGTNARAKYSSGNKMYSIFAIKFGQIMEGEPGLCYAYGGTEGAGDFYKLDLFDKLEDYDAKGMRLVNYSALLLGSSMCVGRIHDIADSAIVIS